MGSELYELVAKIHDELLKRYNINPDKYEREDCFMNVLHNAASGEDMKDSFVKSFDSVYGVQVSDAIYGSCYALCKGFRNWE